MDTYELINKLLDSLNKLISKRYINVRTTNLSNELLGTLKIIKNCTSCKKDNVEEKNFDEFHNLINKIKSKKEEKEKKNIFYYINRELIEIDDELNRKILCEGCKRNKIENL